METNFAVELQRGETCDTFSFRGNIDIQAEKELKGIPRKITKSAVRFDFSNVKRINSMGIAFLLRCFKDIKDEKKAEIILSGLSPLNSMLFKMTGIFLLASPDQ